MRIETTVGKVLMMLMARQHVPGSIGQREERRDTCAKIEEQVAGALEGAGAELVGAGFRVKHQESVDLPVALSLGLVDLQIIQAMVAGALWPPNIRGRLEEILLDLPGDLAQWIGIETGMQALKRLPEDQRAQALALTQGDEEGLPCLSQ